MLKIIKLNTKDWKIFKKFRLKSLKEEPKAFGADYKEWSKKSNNEWKDKLKRAVKSNREWFLFGKKDGEFVGIAGAWAEEGRKVEHLVNIYSVYVAPEVRREGIAKKLMDSLIKEIRKNPKIIKISLRVWSGNKAAIKLYKNLGFKKVALLKKEIKINGKFYDEYEMCKFLR